MSLEELARRAGLSRFHFRMGVPPHAYQTQVRCARARELLRGGMSPALVAGATGFADQSHRTRQFKRMWGVTPGVYFRSEGARTAITY